MLDHLREARALAERLEDDRRRGQVYALMTTVLRRSTSDEALVTGTRALEIAGARGLEAWIVATAISSRCIIYRGEYRQSSSSPPTIRGPSVGAAHQYSHGRAAVGIRPRLPDYELRRDRPISRKRQVRRGGDPNRRTNEARSHHRLAYLRREHAPCSQGDWAMRASISRARDGNASD